MRASAGADDAGARAGATRRRARDARRGRSTFRNYVPRDGALAAAKLPATTAPALDVARAREGDDGAAALALEPNVGDVDPGMVAPRRANWDLKRDVEARLEKLERRTRRALVDVARDEALKRAGERGVRGNAREALRGARARRRAREVARRESTVLAFGDDAAAATTDARYF